MKKVSGRGGGKGEGLWGLGLAKNSWKIVENERSTGFHYCCLMIIAISIIFWLSLSRPSIFPLTAFSITVLLVMFTSLRCGLWVSDMSISIGPLTPDWPLTATGRLTGVLTCWWRKLWQWGGERISVRNSPPPFSLLCTPPSVSLSLFLFLCLSLSVSLCLCFSAWRCRAGQVSVIQGCKLEEDWIYL